MLKIKCTFCPISVDMNNISEFDLGDMELRGNRGVASSLNHTPDQGMMIILSVTMLLDGLRREFFGSKKRITPS